MGPVPPAWQPPTSWASRGHHVTVFERERPCGRAPHVRHPQHEAGQIHRAAPGGSYDCGGHSVRAPEPTVGAGRARHRSCWRSTTLWSCAAAPREPRDLDGEGRQAEGIYFAVDFLTRATKSTCWTATSCGASAQGQGGHHRGRRRHRQRLRGHLHPPGLRTLSPRWR